MTKFFYLSTCSTCVRIMKELNLDGVELKDIKTNPITEEELSVMAKSAGSYEALFSKRSMKYRAWGLNEKTLSENDIKELILKEYTFLKRPVLVLNNKAYVSNNKANVAAMKEALNA